MMRNPPVIAAKAGLPIHTDGFKIGWISAFAEVTKES